MRHERLRPQFTQGYLARTWRDFPLTVSVVGNRGWKSTREVRAWLRAQIGVYLLFVEESPPGMRQSRGLVVRGDVTRNRPWNS